ncbi:MAG: hypothetical protein JSR61_04125 [Proteobacteria bacterium]|nr:hypothetical protein [Pseudomonadota bacterium]
MISSTGTANSNSIYALLAQQGVNGAAKNSDATITPADNSTATSGTNSANKVTTYDFTHMTPNDMKGVASNLYASGKINSTQLLQLQLMAVPVAKVGPNGTPVPLSDAERASFMSQPFDYLKGIQGIIDNLKETGYASDPKSGYQNWQNTLAELKQMQGTTSSVDIAA